MGVELSPLGWLTVVNTVGVAAIGVAMWLFRTGRTVGVRDATVDGRLERVDARVENVETTLESLEAKLAELTHFDASLEEMRRFVEARSKELSDKTSKLQRFLTNAELVLREIYPTLQRNDEKFSELFGDMRERVKACETILSQQIERRRRPR